MIKPETFRPWLPGQTHLMPPSPIEWLPSDHLVFFLLDLPDELDFSAIMAPALAKDPRGEKGFDPRMMTLLLLYAYCTGIASSRKIERACYEDLAFRVLTGNQQPDHSRISEFRRRNLDALSALFVQILRLCQKAGMVSLGLVALDGTKVKANASKHKAMSHERMLKAEAQLEKEIQELLSEAEIVDAQEDGKYGKGKRGSDLPEELQRREDRLEKIRQARTEQKRKPLLWRPGSGWSRPQKRRRRHKRPQRKNGKGSIPRQKEPERRRRRHGSWRWKKQRWRGWSHRIWNRWRAIRCQGAAWPIKPMAPPPPKPREITAARKAAPTPIPTATS